MKQKACSGVVSVTAVSLRNAYICFGGGLPTQALQQRLDCRTPLERGWASTLQGGQAHALELRVQFTGRRSIHGSGSPAQAPRMALLTCFRENKGVIENKR